MSLGGQIKATVKSGLGLWYPDQLEKQMENISCKLIKINKHKENVFKSCNIENEYTPTDCPITCLSSCKHK